MFSPISSCYTNTVGHVSGPGLKCIHFLVIEDHPVSLPNCPGGSPSQLLWKERCWRPLYFSFLRTVQITNPRIYHCIQYSTVSDAFHLTRISREIRPFPSHLKLSFKDLLCTISTFQGKNCLKCLERTFKNREVFDSRCPFAVPQGPGGLALSSLDRKKHRHPPERNACLVDGQHCLVIHEQCATGHPLDEKPWHLQSQPLKKLLPERPRRSPVGSAW